MDVVCITLPKGTCSRLDYFSTKSLEIQSRYNALHSMNTKKMPQYVRLHLCKNTLEKKFPIEIDNILEKLANDKVDIGNTERYENLKCYLKKQKEDDNSISVLIIDGKAKREIAKLGKTSFYIMVIATDDVTKSALTEEFKCEKGMPLIVAKKDTMDVNNLLERILLAPLRKIAEDCHRTLQNDNKNNSTEIPLKLSHSKNSYARPTENKFQTAESEISLISAHASTSHQNGWDLLDMSDGTFGEKTSKSNKCTTELNENDLQKSVDHSKTIYTRSKRRSKRQRVPNGLEDKRRKTKGKLSVMELRSSDLSNNNEDGKESILEAILALYRMSIVPETDKPDVPQQSFRVTEELRKVLFEICPSIKRMGYRYRTFTIYAIKPESSTVEAVRNGKIASVLKEHGIHDFAIAPCEEDITPLMHVGAKIEARSGTTISLRSRTISNPEFVKGGTLGCIVQTNDAGQFGLLSKHVAQNCHDVYYVADNNDKKLGHILPETNRHKPDSLDISAALMEEHIDGTGRKFKNMQGHYAQGQLYHYRQHEEDAIFGRGQSVYIRGASTNPGRGEITMPFVDCGMSTPLIQVEDRICEDGTVQEHFAERGDSGAVVCADVPGNSVHALSMVVGEGTKTTRRRKYITIPLSEGLQQLEHETGMRFEL